MGISRFFSGISEITPILLNLKVIGFNKLFENTRRNVLCEKKLEMPL
jgi:hypothetical protein